MTKGLGFKTFKNLLRGLTQLKTIDAKILSAIQQLQSTVIRKSEANSLNINKYWRGLVTAYDLLPKDNNTLYFVQQTETFKKLGDSLSFSAEKIHHRFNDNGTILLVLIISASQKVIEKYNLSVPYDLTSAVKDSTTLDLYSIFTAVGFDLGFTVSSNGSHIFVVTSNNSGTPNEIRQITLSAPYNLTSPTLKPEKFSGVPYLKGIDISEDGTQIVYAQNSHTINQLGVIQLSTPYEIGTASFSAANKRATGTPYNPLILEKGKKVIAFSNGFREFKLSRPFDFTSLISASAHSSYDLDGLRINHLDGFTISKDGKLAFVVARSSDAQTSTLHRFKLSRVNSMATDEAPINEYKVYLGSSPIKL
ncbi:hypothetical protein PL373_16235 [Tenacibaculum maritimum]|nr:hypothetical protein [Tenacibaculum maritimum]MDB0602651.1 hypothetical protein [Tenacibaculum maritimum]MDB0611238.1 hypothetical protein [Tenacibaculum maritimum]